MHRTLATWLIALPLALSAQQLVQEAVIKGTFDTFTSDELGNVYALEGDELSLWYPDGRSWLRNSLKTFGRITLIDAFYSLKPMVFTLEQGQVAVLDNTLSLQGSVINLPRNGFPQVELACMSVQNSFWLFDARDLQLIRVDAQLRQLASTGRIDQLLGFTPHPTHMQELDNWLYVSDPDEGILVFDLFAAYYKTIPITGIERFEVRDGAIYFFQDGVLQRYDLRSFAIDPLPMPEGHTVLDARMERGRLYLRTPDRILIMRVVEP